MALAPLTARAVVLLAALVLTGAAKGPDDAGVTEIARLATPRERVLAASARMLGVRYLEDPLGEGPGARDPDPLLRFDAVDCQTFVETALAMASARTDEELLQRMNDLRYDGEVSFARRHHYFEAHWLKANLSKGYLRDVTRELFPAEARRLVKTVTPAQWTRRPRSAHFALPADRTAVGSFAVDYLPLEAIEKVAARIPAGTMFAIVRADRPNVPHLVTHMGFVARTADGKAFARHAGRSIHLKVIDEPLAQLVRRHRAYTKWPVLGLMLLEVLEPPAPAPASLTSRP